MSVDTLDMPSFNVKVEKLAFDFPEVGALGDRASRRSATSGQVEWHNVPVSPRDVPQKERGARGSPHQPRPSIIVTQHAAVMGNPPLAGGSGPALEGEGGVRRGRDSPSIKNTLFCLL